MIKLSLKPDVINKVLEGKMRPHSLKMTQIAGFTTKRGKIYEPDVANRAINPLKLKPNLSRIRNNVPDTMGTGRMLMAKERGKTHPLIEKVDKTLKDLTESPEVSTILKQMKTIDTSTAEGCQKYENIKQQLAEKMMGDGFKGIQDKIVNLIKDTGAVTGLNILASPKNRSGIETADTYNSDVQLTGGYVNTSNDPDTGTQLGLKWWDGHFKKQMNRFLQDNVDIASNLGVGVGARYSMFEFDPEWISDTNYRNWTMERRKPELYKASDGKDKFLEKSVEFTLLFDTKRLNATQKSKLLTLLKTASVPSKQREKMISTEGKKHSWSIADLRSANNKHVNEMNPVYRHSVKYKDNKSKAPNGEDLELLFTTLSPENKSALLKKVFGKTADVGVDTIGVNDELYGLMTS